MTVIDALIATSTAAAQSSVSVKIAPADRRCRYWAKVVRAATPLPAPDSVDGANGIPSPYARLGDEELFAGDFLFEGEAEHHRKARGWDYIVSYMGPDGKLIRCRPGSAEKAAMKANGLPANLLPGSGDIAAMVRLAHAVRLGISYT
jgi:hypothetical protein